MIEFQWQLSCDPSDLVYFRQRIGPEVLQRILQVTVELHGSSAREKEVVVDTTVQEKNITHPTGTKLAQKIVRCCWKLADRHEVKLRRRYREAMRHCVMAQRGCRNPKKRRAAHRALRTLKNIAGRMIRELERKLRPPSGPGNGRTSRCICGCWLNSLPTGRRFTRRTSRRSIA
jgi:IS5 family transposase